MKNWTRVALFSIGCLVFSNASLTAQQSDAMRLGVTIARSHQPHLNLTYITASGYEAKLDVYASQSTEAAPTLVYFHGGGWVGGSKELSLLRTMPYLAMGWTVVNVEYRTGRVAPAPAAVEDARCALRYVLRRAKDFNVDTSRIVLSGHSAGAHLALITAMLPVSAGLDRQCSGRTELHVAAVVNWYGITDVVDELDGPNLKEYAVEWLGSQPDREAIARRVSPITYVRAGLPPVITVHGDADNTVPYQHAVRLKEALDRAGVTNELITIPAGKHGGFSELDERRAYTAIEAFLRRARVL
jgi:acetyl esterase/lipase